MLIDGAATVDSLAFLAPAVRIDLFKQMVVPHLTSGKIARFEMFTMDEEAEKDDDLIEPLGVPVYGKSLLYLVSNAFEPETKKAAILGLEERFERDPDIVESVQADRRPSAGVLARQGKASQPGDACADARLLRQRRPRRCARCWRRSRGSPTTVAFPIKDTGCDKASSRALGVGFGGGRGGWAYEAGVWRRCRSRRRWPGAGAAGHAARSASASTAIPPARWPAASATRRPGREALRGLGFDVTMLLDREATRQRVLDALHALIDSARAGDSLVFQYAGHGTQAEDLNGDEADRYDEALVPIDYTSGALLLDDDLAGVYRRLPDGAVLTLFMDCCHSGTNSRFAPIDRSVGARRRATPLPRADPGPRRGAPAVPRRHERTPSRRTRKSRCPESFISPPAWTTSSPTSRAGRATSRASPPRRWPQRWRGRRPTRSSGATSRRRSSASAARRRRG